MPDLCGMLLCFRLAPIGITSDIEKAFLQIGLRDTDRDLTQFWWYKDATTPRIEDNLQIYCFCRVPFGVISSPCLLGATIKYHLARFNSPIAKKISENIYIDNVIIGVQSVDEALALYRECKQIMGQASLIFKNGLAMHQNSTARLCLQIKQNQSMKLWLCTEKVSRSWARPP